MSRLTHRCHIVRNHQDGLVVIVAKIVQQLKQRLARCSVHANHRFVKQEKFCFSRKCSCNHGSLTLPPERLFTSLSARCERPTIAMALSVCAEVERPGMNQLL